MQFYTSAIYLDHRKSLTSLVHHMTLFECTSNSYPGSDPLAWDVWVKSNGAVCNSNLLTPRDWDSCVTPIASWAVSSTGTYSIWYIEHCILYAKYAPDSEKPAHAMHLGETIQSQTVDLHKHAYIHNLHNSECLIIRNIIKNKRLHTTLWIMLWGAGRMHDYKCSPGTLKKIIVTIETLLMWPRFCPPMIWGDDEKRQAA